MTMIIFNYPSKKVLKENVGQRLNFIETSLFGAEYVRTGTMVGANRPHITGQGREFFASVTMKDGLIVSVK
jgi:hypothetical protein|tara:strand:- start:154 stop:366 length:213 start_codon:yes stop_codon:yes gene_type:complete